MRRALLLLSGAAALAVLGWRMARLERAFIEYADSRDEALSGWAKGLNEWLDGTGRAIENAFRQRDEMAARR